MIHGQQSGQRAGSVWGIALASAMGNGIVPRSMEEAASPRATPRRPWSRTRASDDTAAVARRA